MDAILSEKDNVKEREDDIYVIFKMSNLWSRDYK